MEINALLFFSTLFLGIVSLGVAGYYLLVRPANPVQTRLREMNPRATEEVAQPPVSSMIVERVAKFTPQPSPRNLRRLRKRLIQAGYYNENATTIFRVIRLIATLLLPAVTFFSLTVILGKPVDGSTLGLTMVAFGFGAFMPAFLLSRMITKRQGQIARALPDALDLMVVCVEAGLGLNAALHRVGREMELVESNLSEELAVTNRDIRAGKPRDEALRTLGDRTGVDDVKSLVAMLVQTDRFGTSIADSLRVFADSMRTKRRQRAEEMVAKAAIKLIFPLLLFIFPALLIVLMGPALIKIYELLGALG